MNPFVADPEWRWWIILYFFLGGIAAGAYFVGTLVSLIGAPADQVVARWGFRIAFPLIVLCAIFLTVDLEKPARFWHMLFRSEVIRAALDAGWPGSGQGWRAMLDAPLLKFWSPMSIGSWALTLFGVCSFLSFLGSLWPDSRFEGWLHYGGFARIFQVIGCVVGFFIASYTGALLTATNQPLWSDSPWVAPLFLTSAASTGIAALLLLSRLGSGATDATMHSLRSADLWTMILEGAALVIFFASVWTWMEAIWATTPGKVLLVAVPILSVLLPLLLHAGHRALGLWSIPAGSVIALLGGFVLRYAVLSASPAILSAAKPSSAPVVATNSKSLLPGFSPEDGRAPGGGAGADPGNYVGDVTHVQPRSKLAGE
jgi:formate-dependent nitrite reductase membrane component NrfD